MAFAAKAIHSNATTISLPWMSCGIGRGSCSWAMTTIHCGPDLIPRKTTKSNVSCVYMNEMVS
eukprot:gnl/Chilomastix_caulleri/4360.p5 GENE.gnl/Chilomastix_caulleri/4360~~gnl/Chilomastix_caulleri/4360.p5  ORF type:complete len:63 (+),score=1.11 gnl/Chilomastix_caulleri/4360:128-316(+)